VFLHPAAMMQRRLLCCACLAVSGFGVGGAVVSVKTVCGNDLDDGEAICGAITSAGAHAVADAFCAVLGYDATADSFVALPEKDYILSAVYSTGDKLPEACNRVTDTFWYGQASQLRPPQVCIKDLKCSTNHPTTTTMPDQGAVLPHQAETTAGTDEATAGTTEEDGESSAGGGGFLSSIFHGLLRVLELAAVTASAVAVVLFIKSSKAGAGAGERDAAVGGEGVCEGPTAPLLNAEAQAQARDDDKKDSPRFGAP